MRRASRYAFYVTLLIFAALVVAGPSILSLFGEEFRRGYLILVLICGGQVVNAWAGPAALLMTMTGHEGAATRILAWVVAGSVAANLIAIPTFGILGAAVVAGVAVSIWNIWMVWAGWRRTGIRASAW
jgi:O-antigen/teichoic acid export membrane protein